MKYYCVNNDLSNFEAYNENVNFVRHEVRPGVVARGLHSNSLLSLDSIIKSSRIISIIRGGDPFSVLINTYARAVCSRCWHFGV